MFDLEQSIANWRREMFFAGVDSPETLDELEGHLREEIRRLSSLEPDQAEVFTLAAQKIGSAQMLQTEFRKIKPGRRAMRASLLGLGWLVTSGVLFYGIVSLELHWNIFNWNPRWDMEASAELTAVSASFVAIWFLTKFMRDRVSRVISLLACILFVAFGLFTCPAEALHQGGAGWLSFSRSQASPIWYRGGRVVLLALPAVLWFYTSRRHSAPRHRFKTATH